MRLIVFWGLWLGLLMPMQATGPWYPAQQAQLNFTEIWFRWPLVPEAGQYVIQISEKPDFSQLLVAERAENPDFLLREGLEFGQTYYWRVWVYQGLKKKLLGEQRQFSLLTSPTVSGQHWRHNVTLNDTSWQDDYLFCIDKPGVIINRQGKPVWFHPDTQIVRLFDLRVLPNGHISYLRPKGRRQGNENLQFEEISLSGQTVWLAPDQGAASEDTIDRYHHEYQILRNGNYLLLGDEYVNLEAPNGAGPVFCRMGLLLEYNPAGELVWSWRTRDHLLPEDIFARGLQTNPVHLNGFDLDESSGLLYLSFRYLDRIVEVEKSSSRILRSFGTASPGQTALWPGRFHAQHSPEVVAGSLILYDNGSGKGSDTISALQRLSLHPDADSSDTYRFPLEFGNRHNSWSESKGDVDLMAPGTYLVGMGSLPRTLVIQEEQGIVWMAEHQHRPHPEAPWTGVQANYRSDPALTLWPVRYSLSWTGSGRKGMLHLRNTGTRAASFRLQRGSKQWQTPVLEVGEYYAVPMRKKQLAHLQIRL